MRVSVKYFGIFNKLTERKEEDIDLIDGEDIDFLLRNLISKYGKQFKNYIYDEATNERLATTLIFANGKTISALNNSKTKLNNNDCIMITPLVTGG